VLVLSIFSLRAILEAQGVGASIVGTVTDPSGSPLPAAAVVVRNLENGALRKLISDDAGRYAALSLPVGNYEVTGSKEGFRSTSKTGIALVVGEKAEVALELAVGEVRESVMVVEQATPVNTSTEQTSGLVGEKQVKDLPLNGRSYDQLMTLNPAVVNYSAERSGGVGTSNSAVGNMFAVSGRRPQENLFLLNGIEYTGASLINLSPGGTSGQLLGVDAVREFNVVTDTYGAEYGKRPGAQVSIVTASGANQIHGALYEFLRNSDLDARNFFDQGAIPQFQRNVFGGSLGGPIRKDKLFLFGNYEGYRQHLGLSDVTLVPDNAARTGIVSGSNVGVAPGVAQLLNLWPVQNGPDLGGGVAEAFSHPLQRLREDFGTTRLDYNPSIKDTFSAVYTVDDSDAHTPSVNPLSSVFETLREQVISAQEQHVFSPTTLNTFRAGFSRAGYFFTGETPVNLPGWVAGAPIGAVVIGGGTALNGASQISAAGTNAGSNLHAARNLFTYEDHVSLSRGIHQIEAGVWVQRMEANDSLAQDQYGQASFGSLAAFLQGTVSTFTVVPSPTPLGWRSLEAAGFVQDAIKLRHNLQERIGYRFESTNGWNEAHGRASNYTFDANGVISSTPRIASSAFTENHAKFLPEPRIGIAWDPFGKGRTVIHAGFGIYYALLDDLDYRMDQNGPFNTTVVQKNVPISSLLFTPGQLPPSGSLVSPSGIQPDARTPGLVTYTFRIEQQIAPETSISASYVGSHGFHEVLSVDANEPAAGVCPTSACPAGLANGTLYYPKNAPFANPSLANTTTWFTNGLSSYNGLEVDVSHRLSRGFQIRGVYAFAKSLDDGTAWNSSVGTNAPGFVMYPANPKLDWSRSTYDVAHLASIHGVYELPMGRGKSFWRNASGLAGKFAEGWSVTGIATLQSGFPLTPQLGFNPSNNGDSRNPVRPSWNPAFTGPVILGGPNQYFDPNAFIVPVAGTYGNVGRDVLTGPGLADLDVSVLKTTRLTERVAVQFRAEFFNVLNHANFGTPNAVVFSSASTTPAATAGVITSTSTTSRQSQLGLKLQW
jgi:hypothetical protein